MAELALFFGSDDGNTEAVAHRIQQRFGESVIDLHDIAHATQLDFSGYDKFILGIPTWDFGQIQSDWEEFWSDIAEVDFKGKIVALYGLGDQFGYGDFFLDAMGMLHDVVLANGGEIVGHWSTATYEFDASKACIQGQDKFVGLGIDEDQQPELTGDRLNRWCRQLVLEFDLDIEVADLDD
ncbi:MAG: flavodoxin [Cellvibrionaceae bacterium]|nr:flavodoxin [Cellvibrionaceae bacterium]